MKRHENEINAAGCNTADWPAQEVGSSSAAEKEETSKHSPWELFDENVTADGVREEAPTLDDQVLSRTMMAVEQALADPQYSVFVKVPSARECHPGPNRGERLSEFYTLSDLYCLLTYKVPAKWQMLVQMSQF